MRIGYVRVSTLEQNLERQKEGLEKYNIDEWFEEKVSGKNTNREKLEEMLRFVRKGDTVYVHSLDRLARNIKDLLDIVDQLTKKEVHIISAKENIDTTTATGKLMLGLLGVIAEFERTNMLERQREGIDIARREGKYKGRKRIEYPDNWKEVYDKWNSRKITAVEAMNLTGLKKNTFYNLLNEYQEKLKEETNKSDKVEEVKEVKEVKPKGNEEPPVPQATTTTSKSNKEQRPTPIELLIKERGIVDKPKQEGGQ